MTKITVRFDASAYVRSHAKQPRGAGHWAFGLGTDEIYWAPGYLPLTLAKQWFAAHVQNLPNMPRHLVVEVLP